MSESGAPSESWAPGEESSGVSEAAREQAAQRFAASQQAAAQQQKDEKKAKKRDDSVAQVILQFLTDTQKTHLATLIARLVARNCPSTFILAVLSLINERCAGAVDEYLREKQMNMPEPDQIDRSIVPAESSLTESANALLATWIVRMDLAMKVDEDAVLKALIVDDQNIDGTILQLTTFVLQEFLQEHQKNAAFENLQQLAASILQSIFTPAMHARMEHRLEAQPEE